MCLVEIEKFPKLQIACHVPCAEGMVVRTDTNRVKKTREHILEFLLVNHPLDCPVCDQAGECKLQDYYMDHGRYQARLDEVKVKKTKKAFPIGPTVMLDTERCILCSRCVRFADEVTKTSEFGIFNRGDRSEIGLYPGKELNNPYSGNVVDICPVGALTDRDFRFKCRVWYLKKTESICNGCARGCNITFETNTERVHHGHGERVMRIKPRYQPEVNQWWICDQGRYDYKWIDHGRVMSPALGPSPNRRSASWQEVISEVVAFLKGSNDETVVFLSPQLSNETLYLAKKLFVETLKLPHVYLLSARVDGEQDDILMRADKHPNRSGAELLDFTELADQLKLVATLAQQNKIKNLYLFGQDLLSQLVTHQIPNIFEKIPNVIYQGTNTHLTSEAAHVILPSTAYAEANGTFTNFEGKVQPFWQAILPIGEAQSDIDILLSIAKALPLEWVLNDFEAVASEMRERYPAFRKLVAPAKDQVFS